MDKQSINALDYNPPVKLMWPWAGEETINISWVLIEIWGKNMCLFRFVDKNEGGKEGEKGAERASQEENWEILWKCSLPVYEWKSAFKRILNQG